MIPFSPPRIDQKIIDEVTAALKSGWITTGPRTKEFEKRITAYCGNKSTICLSSATAGLEIMLRWFGVGPGDEVIVPAYTYCASANVILHCGATPVMVDINEEDFNAGIADVKSKITNKTKVIIPVDISGFPCDYDELMALVDSDDISSKFSATTKEQKDLGRILVLADAAHSFGAWYKGKRSGSLADVNIFSFHAVKNLVTAEGGAVCLNLPKPFDNESVYKYLCMKTLHGQSKDALAKTQKGNWKYDVLEPGYKANMTDLQAAIGLVELDRYDSENLVKRKEIFDFYQKFFSQFDWANIPMFKTEEKEGSYHLFLLRVNGIEEDTRDAIIQKIFDLDVSVNVHFQPLPLLTAYKERGFDIKDYPESYNSYKNVITLPVYFDLTNDQLNTICNAVKEAVESTL
jgi:dTDP-4-amino-4,6-dideoxygalactose transaminase